MKALKQITRTMCAVLGMLLLNSSASAVTNVTNGGTYYVCQGSANYFAVTPQSPYVVNYSYWWQIGNSSNTSSTFPYTIDNYTVTNLYNSNLEAEITANSLAPITITVLTGASGINNGPSITFTIIPCTTTISGPSLLCGSATGIYTATTNVPNVKPLTGYTWVGSSSLTVGTSTSYQDIVNATTGTGTLSVTVHGSCPASSESNIATFSVTDESAAALTKPVGFQFNEMGKTCYYNGTIHPVTGATGYVWSMNSSFSPSENGSTTSPYTFDKQTSYTIYVKAENACATSPVAEFIMTTPKPVGVCLEGPEKLNNTPEETEQFRFYPNPASTELNIQYIIGDDTPGNITIDMYDMLGKKVMSSSLSTGENHATENVSGLSKGMYIYIVSSGDNILQRGKILIQR
jgi:hypothetical protein